MTDAVVKFDRVSKRFVIRHQHARSFQDTLVNFFHQQSGSDEEFWALRDVCFEVQRGETLGIIGQNGSGKSTILKMITRILEPTSGRIGVEGRVSALIELGAGFHPDLSGRENVYLNGSILGFSRKQMNRLFDEIVEFAELERFIDTPVKHYSSGMFARLGFAVAISVDPDVLIIDEVLSVGDESFQRKCFDRLATHRRSGKTIIFVSHSMDVVEKICDRAIWLHDGMVRSNGSTVSAIREYMIQVQHHDEERREAIQHQTAAVVELDSVVTAQARVEDIKVLTVQRTEQLSFWSGDTVVARIHYQLGDPTTDHTLTLDVRRSDGMLVGQLIHRLPWVSSADGMAPGTIDLQLHNFPLCAGSFEFAAALRESDANLLADEYDARAAFSVWGQGDQAGIVQFEHSWVIPGNDRESPAPEVVAAELTR